MSVDNGNRYFPNELPERPPKTPKFGFTRRLSEALNVSKLMRRDSLTSPISISKPVLEETTSPILFDPACVIYDPPRKGEASNPAHARKLSEAADCKHAASVPTSPATIPRVFIPDKKKTDVSRGRIGCFSTNPNQISLSTASLQSSSKQKELAEPNRRDTADLILSNPILFNARLDQAGLSHKHMTMTTAPAALSQPCLSPSNNITSPLSRNQKKATQNTELVLNWLQSGSVAQQGQAAAFAERQTNDGSADAMAGGSKITPTSISDDGSTPVSGRTRSHMRDPPSGPRRVPVRGRIPRQGRHRSRSPSPERSKPNTKFASKRRLSNVELRRLTVDTTKPQSPKIAASSPKREARFIDSQDAVTLQGMLGGSSTRQGYQQGVSIKFGRGNAVRLSGPGDPKRDSMELNMSRSRYWRTVPQAGTREDPIQIEPDSSSDETDPDDEINTPDSEPMGTYPSQLLGKGLESVDATRTHQSRKNASSSGLRFCTVCDEQFPISSFPSLPDCAHQPQTCSRCYSDWTAAQLDGSGWTEAKCPESKCSIILSYHEIKHYASPQIFDRYDTFITRAVCNEDPNFHWCLACSSGQIHSTGIDGNIFTCASCGTKACIAHPTTLHEGETCADYDYRISGAKEREQREQEEASRRAVDKLSKKCPGEGCVYSIEKNNGCDHMTCSKCRYEFCWICLCDYDQVRRLGNSMHKEGCKYHTTQIR